MIYLRRFLCWLLVHGPLTFVRDIPGRYGAMIYQCEWCKEELYAFRGQ
jgi:hypothetical protein